MNGQKKTPQESEGSAGPVALDDGAADVDSVQGRDAASKEAATSTRESEKASAAGETDAGGDNQKEPEKTSATNARRRTVGSVLANRTITLKSALAAVAGLVVVVMMAVLIWMVADKSSEIDDMKSASADNAHAEQVALDYAAGAARMSYEDIEGWRERLTANTTPELNTRLRDASQQMEQLLRPLQWSSTSSPIAAAVSSVDGDVYQVDAFVEIVTKNVQAPADGVGTTATYKLTIDKSQGWKITAITSNGTNMDAGGATPSDSGSNGTAPEEPAAPEAPAVPEQPDAGGVPPAGPGN